MKLFILILLMNSLVSCGGGSTPTPTPTTRIMTTNIIRAVNASDFITYNISGTSITGAAVTTFAGAVTDTFVINAAADQNGLLHDAYRTTRSITANGVPAVIAPSDIYYDQLPNGSLFTAGSQGSWIVGLPVGAERFRSPILVGSAWINNYSYQSGEILAESISSDAKVIISTAIGLFESFKITRVTNRTFTNNLGQLILSVNETEVDYYVPSIGIIKTTINSVTNLLTVNGIVITVDALTAVMATTNIAF